MGSSFTVTVSVKETIPQKAIEDSKGYPLKGIGGGAVMTDLMVVDRLRLIVSADNEEEAVERVMSMLITHQNSLTQAAGPAAGPADGEAARPL